MSSNFSSSTTRRSQSQTSSTFSSVPLSVPEPSTPASVSPPPFQSPSPPPPFISSDFLTSSSSSSAGSSSLSSLSSESSYSTFVPISPTKSFPVGSSTSLKAASSISVETTVPASTTSVTTTRVTLRPVQIAAIVFGVVTAVLGIIAVLLVFCFRRKRRHHPLYGLPYAKESKGVNKSPPSHLDALETTSGPSYFRSLSEQKGTTPLLQNSAPNSSDHSNEEPYRYNESSGHTSFLAQVTIPPLLSFSPQAYPILQNTMANPSPRSPPPSKPQDYSPILSLPIPGQEPAVRPLQPPPQNTDALPRDVVLAYTDDLDEESSVYSQPSANFRFSSSHTLSRGPSASSHVSVRRISVPPAALESIIGGGSPTEENAGHDVEMGSEDGGTISSETITPATLALVPASSPPNRPVAAPPADFLTTDPFSDGRLQHHSDVNWNSGLERQNTSTIASLLKSRQQRRPELLPTAPSGVSHVERTGSIRPAPGSEENTGLDGHETYGRRFRRMKREQGN